jgi:hypothetical protein
MRRPAKAVSTSLRGLEQRLHERLFGRSPSRKAPRYGRDAEASAALTERLESQGLLVRPAPHGLTIEDLALRTTYSYGTTAVGGGGDAELLVRSALFALSARSTLLAHSAPRQSRPRVRRRGTTRFRRAA